jgi:hypothetical protein
LLAELDDIGFGQQLEELPVGVGQFLIVASGAEDDIVVHEIDDSLGGRVGRDAGVRAELLEGLPRVRGERREGITPAGEKVIDCALVVC